MPQYSGIWTEQAVMQAVGAGNWPGNPGAPTIGTATGGNASASVAFTAPTDNGGSAITGYTVTSSPGGLTGTGASSPITVSGLTNGTAYTFTVTATNATGTGPASAASNSVTPVPPNYIEDVYSTYIYAGNGSTQTITNGIDLAGEGGLVWTKRRSSPTANNAVMDTVRGMGSNGAWTLITDDTTAQFDTNVVTSFNSNGFTLGSSSFGNSGGGFDYVSWTFRKQAKFFDIVTYSGNGVAGREIPHNLGSTPGCVIIKCLNGATNWSTWHRGIATNQVLFLNTTDASYAEGDFYATAPTSTVFTVNSFGRVNASGYTYVAYLFAHNAGGFGPSDTDNVISCGSYTGNGSNDGPTVTLGYEPQWLLIKDSTTAKNWQIFDNMRGMVVGLYNSDSDDAALQPNLSNAESLLNGPRPNATGFSVGGSAQVNTNASTYIYIAIRRGPMKVPTSGTSVFSPVAYTGTGTSTAVTTPGFPPDVLLQARRSAPDWPMSNRLAGVGQNLAPCYTSAENTPSPAYVDSYNMTGATIGAGGNAVNGSGLSYIQYYFERAPSFFDEVCYTGNGVSGQAYNHNLGVAPELMIVKARGNSYQWWVYDQANGKAGYSVLNTNSAWNGNTTVWGNANPTASVFTVGSQSQVNESGTAFVAYLFATCAGVSKVGSYTGTGATQTINCGFSAGARWVMIKRTDSTGDWYVWDTARGMVSGTDPSLLLNSTAAEVNANSVYTTTVGFQIVSTASGINASGGTYIFLAIA